MNDCDSEIGSISDLQERNQELEEELKRLEQQIYKLETNYLEEAWTYGTALKGSTNFY
jgi:peptidoglycan hydrolase CwlO-like protein